MECSYSPRYYEAYNKRRQSTKISSSENALHWMIRWVPRWCSTGLVARCTQVIVIADQTFVTLASEVTLHTRITADTCITSNNIHMMQISIVKRYQIINDEFFSTFIFYYAIHHSTVCSFRITAINSMFYCLNLISSVVVACVSLCCIVVHSIIQKTAKDRAKDAKRRQMH